MGLFAQRSGQVQGCVYSIVFVRPSAVFSATEQATHGHDVGILAASTTEDRLTSAKFAAIAEKLRLGIARIPISRQPGLSDMATVRAVRSIQNTVYLFATTLVGVATVAAFQLLNLYSLRALSAYVRNMPAAVFGWTVSFAPLVAGVFFLKIGPEVSRVWLATWFVSGAAALLAQRLIAGWCVRSAARSGRLYQRAVIYGAGPVTEELISELEADTDSIVRIAGVFDDRRDVETGARRARSADIRD